MFQQFLLLLLDFVHDNIDIITNRELVCSGDCKSWRRRRVRSRATRLGTHYAPDTPHKKKCRIQNVRATRLGAKTSLVYSAGVGLMVVGVGLLVWRRLFTTKITASQTTVIAFHTYRNENYTKNNKQCAT